MGVSSAVGSLGFKPGVCTSTTRPTNPYEGQLIFETDTDSVAFWDGSYWRYIEARKNLLYNGAMQVAQRGTSTASITTSNYYTADRWKFNNSSIGTWTNTIENDAPTGSGFRKSFKVLCTTAEVTPAAGDENWVGQVLEGQDVQAIRKGTSSAQQLTVSFWVKANVTGTYITEFYDGDNSRQISKAYTINAANTWEFKTIVVPADTTGAFDNDNAQSLYVVWWLGGGSNFTSGTLNSTAWASVTNANRAVGQTNLASATNNYWQITGVQLNVGSVAAPFEFKSYGQELRECQRYYEKSYDIATAPGTNTGVGLLEAAVLANSNGNPIHNLVFQVQKRSTGYSMTFYRADGTAGSWTLTRYTSATETNNTMTYDNRGSRSVRVYTSADTAAAREPCRQTGHWVVSDEL